MEINQSNNENEPEGSKAYKARKKLRTSWIFEQFTLPNPKTGDSIKTEASIEHDYVLKAFFTPSILHISTDIDSINSESQNRRYTGDIRVYEEDEGLYYIDCKDSESMKRQKNIDKFDALADEFDDAGSKLEVVTEKQIRSGYLIANLKRFYIYLAMPKPEDVVIEVILKCVESKLLITLGELKVLAAEKSIGMRPIWYCLAHKLIQTNLEQYITKKSILWSKNYAV